MWVGGPRRAGHMYINGVMFGVGATARVLMAPDAIIASLA
jgi:hypothetical protein